MRYFKKNKTIKAFDDTVKVSDWGIDNTWSELSLEEIDRIENPDNYLTHEEKAQLAREQMPALTPIQFDIKLNRVGLYNAVQDLVKDNFELRIAYNRATYFSRTDPFIGQARLLLGLTDEQVDEMWMSQSHLILK